MKRIKIRQVIAEARLFIKAAEAAAEAIEKDSLIEISGSKETGACRRASMELTRALADLRRP